MQRPTTLVFHVAILVLTTTLHADSTKDADTQANRASPSLDRVVAEGMVFNDCHTPCSTAPSRPRAPFKTLYSNDTTNITSCISPYHELGQPISDERLRATIDEARGVDVHMLQPGLGWIPWWQSKVYSADDHYGYYQREYGQKPNNFGRYLLSGGDLVRTFVEHCRKTGVVPFISYRLNDGHHSRELAESLKRGKPSQTISRFYWENYDRYRIGPDPNDWSQSVLNWAIPEVREHKFRFLREICTNYDIAGLELDFMRHWNNFDVENTTAEERCAIMTAFVARVRQLLDETTRRGEYRWLCARVPVWADVRDRQGVDLAAFAAAGVDMVNLSASYFTRQAIDLDTVRKEIPNTPFYLEMTHTTTTGRATAGSGTQPYRRTTDEQFHTTAHLAYTSGAAGVSLFNFVYYRYHKMPELGPFNEPPFHVLPRLSQPDWLARQPQSYFLAAGPSKPATAAAQLPALVKPGQTLKLELSMFPTSHQFDDGILRIMAQDRMPDGAWQVILNGAPLEPRPFIAKPLDHPYESFLGTAEQYACFICPRSAVQVGRNSISVTRSEGHAAKLIYLDCVLP
jgi:hypothetical protein